MKRQVFITSKAKRQLADAALWWAENRSRDQAVRWLGGFESAIAALSENAEQQPLARENDLYELPHPVRQLVYGLNEKPTHRAVFEIRNKIVYVAAVRHLAQDDLAESEL